MPPHPLCEGVHHRVIAAMFSMPGFKGSFGATEPTSANGPASHPECGARGKKTSSIVRRGPHFEEESRRPFGVPSEIVAGTGNGGAKVCHGSGGAGSLRAA